MPQLCRRRLEGNDDAASLLHLLEEITMRQRALPRIVFTLRQLRRLFSARLRRLSAIRFVECRRNAALAVFLPLDPENLLLETADVLRRGCAQSVANLPGLLVSPVQRREKALLLLRQR